MYWLQNLISTLRCDSTLEKLKVDLINKSGAEVRLKTREKEGGIETDKVVGWEVGNEASSHLITSMSSVWDSHLLKGDGV